VKKRYIIISALMAMTMVNTVQAKEAYSVNRIDGRNRFETSANISSKFSSAQVQNVIIASGSNFPDALTGSVLSKKFNAPILLVDKTVSGSSNAVNYIKGNLVKDGTIYILGGKASVDDKFLDYFKSQGYNVKRLGGSDRFATNKTIVNSMNVEKGTPVVIANGYGFADALSISSVAALKGYPILMSNKINLPSDIKSTINDIQPSKVFLIGGEGSLSNSLIDELKNIVSSLDDSSVVRIGGNTRYETSLNICKYFNLDTTSAVIASGKGFPDALSGSALAAKLNAPIILTDGSNIIEQKRYLDATNYSNLFLLGGKASVSEVAAKILNGQEKFLFHVNKGYIKDDKRYVEGYFDKFISDLNEAREYERETGESVIEHDDQYGDFLTNDGFDAPISGNVTLEVSKDLKISGIIYTDEGLDMADFNGDFGFITSRDYNIWKIFEINLQGGIVTEMNQQYRP